MKNIVKNWNELPVFIDVNLAACLFGLNKRTVQKLCQTGDLPAFKVNKSWRLKKEELEKWVNKQSNCA